MHCFSPPLLLCACLDALEFVSAIRVEFNILASPRVLQITICYVTFTEFRASELACYSQGVHVKAG